MLNNIYIKPIIALLTFILIFACSKDEDPEPANEEEVITLVTLEVTKVGSSSPIKYNFEVEGHDHGDEDHEEEDDDDHDDHDGEHTEIELEANSTYNVSMFIYNDTDPNNIENVTLEIIEEKDEHQI